MDELLENVKKEWGAQYKATLRSQLIAVCNAQVLNPELIAIGQSLECDIKSIVAECLKELSKDVEENTLILR